MDMRGGTQTISCFEGEAESFFFLPAGLLQYCRIGISRLGLDTIVLDDVEYMYSTCPAPPLQAQHVFVYL